MNKPDVGYLAAKERQQAIATLLALALTRKYQKLSEKTESLLDKSAHPSLTVRKTTSGEY